VPDRTEIISSPQNAKLKALASLREKKDRQATGLCLVEGAREILMAAESGHEVAALFFCPAEITSGSTAERTLNAVRAKSRQVFELGEAAFAKVAMREGSDGLLASVRFPVWKWEDVFGGSRLHGERPPLVLAAQNVEKPGNLGALLRTAEAAGADALVTLDETVDAWNPNAIRASLGCVFRVPVINMSSAEFASRCAEAGITTVAAALAAKSRPHHETDMRGPTAIVMGAEAHGLSRWWLDHADSLAVIPMHGKVDSMNVSVAAGILVFEALRQRS
jgi:TrmH family RNA methyltransferase